MKIFRLLLVPVSWIYCILLSIRHFMYDVQLLQSFNTNIQSICIGSLQMGGTGKTPLVEYLLTLLKHKKIAVLSRGYKRDTSGFKWVNNESIFNEVGDEVLQIKNNNPNILVAVCEDRLTGVKLIKEKGSEIVLFDDAFQHRRIKSRFNIITTPFLNLFIKDSLFPLGRLRDLKYRAKKADVIVVTKSPSTINRIQKNKIISQIQTSSNQKVCFSYLQYLNPYDIFDFNTEIELDCFETSLVITGIGRSEEFLNYIKTRIKEYKHLKFSDHHFYTKRDIQKIKEEFKYLGRRKKIIITTQKDSMRLIKYKEILKGILVVALPVKVVFENDEFDKIILNYVR